MSDDGLPSPGCSNVTATEHQASHITAVCLTAMSFMAACREGHVTYMLRTADDPSEGRVQIRAHLQHRRREQLREVRVVLGEQAPNDVGSSGMQHCARGCVAACILT